MYFFSPRFWACLYSRCSNHGSCSHSWAADSRRYVYSLRHMYGLEGGRRVRYAHSCVYLQVHFFTIVIANFIIFIANFTLFFSQKSKHPAITATNISYQFVIIFPPFRRMKDQPGWSFICQWGEEN